MISSMGELSHFCSGPYNRPVFLGLLKVKAVAMKFQTFQRVGLLLLIACAYAPAAILFTATCARASDLTVGFLYDSSMNDSGWTAAHNQGRLFLESKVPGIKTIVAENIPESSEAERVLEKMVAQ